ncbi:MAG: hypothetical protein JXP37_08980 [Coriobacteriia bacterium]|nr:hypothetical protein [Coriobacteriia bacterium]
MVTPENEIPTPADQPSQTPVPAADEVVGTRSERRAAEPQRGKTLTRIVVAVAVVVAFAALAAYGFRWVTANERVRDARDEVESAARLLDVAEDDLLIVDAAVQADVSSEIATQSAEALVLASSVATELADVAVMIEEALPDLPEADLPLAQALLESAQARADMMREAPAVLEADLKAARAIAFADRALEELKAAETLSAQAAVEFNKHTEAGVRASNDASVKAEERLAAARSLLASATVEFPEADYAAFTAYIDAKVALVGISKQIDQLWLAGKIEDSNKQLTTYNTRDAEVVAMAKALPESMRDPIADAYKQATEEAFGRYFAARETARSAGERVEDLREAVPAGDE